MSKPLLSVELEGQESILNLRKSPDAKPVVKIVLKNRDRPDLKGLQCSFQREDLEIFKEIKGSVNLVLQRIVSP